VRLAEEIRLGEKKRGQNRQRKVANLEPGFGWTLAFFYSAVDSGECWQRAGRSTRQKLGSIDSGE
jgi:hypothetical protein